MSYNDAINAMLREFSNDTGEDTSTSTVEVKRYIIDDVLATIEQCSKHCKDRELYKKMMNSYFDLKGATRGVTPIELDNAISSDEEFIPSEEESTMTPVGAPKPQYDVDSEVEKIATKGLMDASIAKAERDKLSKAAITKYKQNTQSLAQSLK